MGIRRAQCFRCREIFDIAPIVARLLNPPREAVPEEGPGGEPADILDMEDAPGSVGDPVPEEPTTLTLGDLEGAETEIMDKTVVDLRVPPPADPMPDPRFEPPPPAEYRATGTYTSARDAISKLLGGAPGPAPHPPAGGSGMGMVEETLTAMDSTLRTPPPPPPTHSSSTVKISSRDIQSALAGPPPPPHAEPAEGQEQNLLKFQIGDETFNNMTPETANAWIAQGRLQEHHMVARQFSDHWIEASKVPILRPLFEVMRKGHPLPEPSPAPEPPQPRRGLFGGLFGRG
jgi:hypothetical protein